MHVYNKKNKNKFKTKIMKNVKLLIMKNLKPLIVKFFVSFATLALVVLFTGGLFSSCHKKGELDVVNGIIPVSTDGIRGFDIKAFREADSAGRVAMFKEKEQDLIANIMRLYPCIQHANRIKMSLVSGTASGVQSGDGNLYHGRFNHEILVEVVGTDEGCVKGKFFLACANGVLEDINFTSRTELTQCRYVVQYGESLYSILEILNKNELWMGAAQRMDLGIRDAKGKKVSYETYSKFLGKYFSMLREGDIIDFCDEIVYQSNGSTPVDFDQRQADTDKANAKAKKSVKHPVKKV